jgi:hypothetical protein
MVAAGDRVDQMLDQLVGQRDADRLGVSGHQMSAYAHR